MMSETGVQSALAVELPVSKLSKGEEEYQAFLGLLPQLLRTHFGKYVAIHDRQVVDTDTDEVALILRVHTKLGYVPIHVGLVTDAQPVIRIPHYHERRPQGDS
jgi:hypothetical protein